MPLRVARLALSLPLTAIALNFASPAKAASFAGANAEAQLFNFNVAALSTNTFADTDAFSNSGDFGAVLNFNDANITFLQDPARLDNVVVGTSEGSGTNYLGRTEGSTEALGQFRVDDLFSFQFDTGLDLAYSIDDPIKESAEAAGALNLSLFSSSEPDQLGALVDQFSLTGNVSTDGKDFLNLSSSPNFSFALEDCPAIPSESCRLRTENEISGQAFANIGGIYERQFKAPSYLTLIETKFSGTLVQVPESSMTLALLLGGATLLWKRHDKTVPLED